MLFHLNNFARQKAFSRKLIKVEQHYDAQQGFTQVLLKVNPLLLVQWQLDNINLPRLSLLGTTPLPCKPVSFSTNSVFAYFYFFT